MTREEAINAAINDIGKFDFSYSPCGRRDPKRIDSFLKSLGECWKKVPDWRFGQFISNAFRMLGRDPFFPEDQEMIAFFEDVFLKGDGKS